MNKLSRVLLGLMIFSSSGWNFFCIKNNEPWIIISGAIFVISGYLFYILGD